MEKELDRMIGPHIHRLAKLSHRCLEQMPGFKCVEKVTGTKAWIIGYLASQTDRDIYQKDFEQVFGMSRSAACKLIDRMEENDLIRRESVPGDARLKRLVLTDKARQINEEVENNLVALNERMIEGFTEEELKLLRSYFVRMEENLMHQKTKE